MPERTEWLVLIFAVLLCGLSASMAWASHHHTGGPPPAPTPRPVPIPTPVIPLPGGVDPILKIPQQEDTPPPDEFIKKITKDFAQNVGQITRPSFVIESRYAVDQNTVAVSQDSSLLATGGANGSVQLWSLLTGQRIGALDAGSPVRAVEFSSSGAVVSGHEDGLIIVWQTARGEKKSILKTAGPVNVMTLTASPVAAGITRGMVKRKKTTPQPSEPREQYLATPDGRGRISLWSLERGEIVRTLSGGDATVSVLVASSIDTTLISADENGVVTSWDVESGARLQELAKLGARVSSLVLSLDGRFLAAGAGDGSVHLWQMPGGQRIFDIKAHEGPVSSMAFTPDGSTLVTIGGDRQIKNWSSADGTFQFESRGHWDTVNDLAFSPSGRYIISAGIDRTVRFWSREDGREKARLVAMREGWAVVTPEGYFDGTLDGAIEDRLDAIQWVVGKRSLGIDSMMEHYYQPALLGKMLAGKPIGIAADLPRIEDGFLQPPLVRITSPSPDSRIDQRTIQVTVEATDQGGGIDEIRFFHNRKIVDNSHAQVTVMDRGAKNEKVLTTYPLTLVDGENILTVRGLSRHRIESEIVEMAVSYAGEEKQAPPALNLFLVGINSYQNPAMDLNFGVPDAMGVGTNLARRAIFPEYVQKKSLFDSEATRQGILNGLDGLAGLPPQDTLVLYFAGHGDTVDDDWYFIPHDLTEARSEIAVREMGISSGMLKEYITRIKAGRVVLILDACKAGAAVDVFTPFEEYRPIALLTRATGIHVAAAATGEQFANELETLGHGLFTYALLEALGGKADQPPYDSRITVVETLNFLREKVPLLSEEHRTMTQKPVISSRGLDFPLAVK